jgi:hypothetical protein
MLRAAWLALLDPFASREAFAAACAAGEAPSVYSLAAWELDYVFTLFPGARWHWVHEPGALAALQPDVVVLMSNDYAVDRALAHWTPKVLVHLSDEWGAQPDTHRHTLNVSLVLRQYRFAHYFHAPNVRQIPIGFTATMFDDASAIPAPAPIAQRRWKWSFVGNMKGDRRQMLQAFQGWTPHWQAVPFGGSQCRPRDMARVYGDAAFVLCPRGNVSMNSMRSYEATLCGAIPVVAGGSATEYQESFRGLGDPPWIFCETWKEARAKCETLLASGAAQALQQRNLRWWTEQMASLRAAIAAALPQAYFSRDDFPRPI